MTDTPETDDLARGNHVVPTEFAEQLERERNALIAETTKSLQQSMSLIAEATNAVNDIIGVRWKLNSLTEACQNLIDVKERHNTEIAFSKMKCILESITKQTNES